MKQKNLKNITLKARMTEKVGIENFLFSTLKARIMKQKNLENITLKARIPEKVGIENFCSVL